MELVIAMAMLTIIFAVVLPQFAVIRNSWDIKQSSSEMLQNGRVLMDHINRNLAKAKQIAAVSSSSIDFNDCNGVTWRYNIGAGSYVQFGQPGSMSDLAGPVSSLVFTCYDACDLGTPITTPASVRVVKVDATVTNSASSSRSMSFTTEVYLRVNSNTGTGIVGCWKLDETSGLTAADGSGSGNNGTLANGPTWNPAGGQIGGALVFDGADDYVNLGTDSSLNFGSSAPFTVAAWVKTTENYGMIVSFRSSTDGGPVINLSVGYDGVADNSGKAMILVRQDGGSSYAHVIGGSVNDGLWHHLAAVRGSGSTIELFLDGVSQGTASDTQSGGAITTNLRAIGSERRWVSDSYGTPDQRYLAGTIDDVRVYNRALTPTEIAQLANISRYRNFSENKTTSDVASLAVSIPAGTSAGDLLIAAVAADGNPTISTPAGWTLIDCGSNGTVVTLGAWRKIAGASESAPTFTWTGGNEQAYGWIMRFTGHNAASPINASYMYGQKSITPTSPEVTTTVNNCLIFRLGAFDGNDVNILPAPGNPGLSGHTAITMNTTGSRDSVGWWKLDETSGLTAADNSGYGNNGTLVNGPTWNPTGGQIGGALVFDGADDYVNLGTDSSLNFGSSAPFTVTAWVKTTENYGMIVSFRSSTDGGPVIDLAVGYEGGADDLGKAMILIRQDGSSSYAHVKGGSVNDGQWHHLAVVRGSGSTIELFLDGVSQGTASDTQSGGAITTNLRAIGSERRWVSDGYGTPDQRYLAGTIDDVRIYSRALSAGDIIALWNCSGLGGGSVGTVSGGAGYIRQPTAGSSGTSTFTLGSSNDAMMMTIAIAPASNGALDCCPELRP
jgi:type II secretory pathway pseudopilin PulG